MGIIAFDDDKILSGSSWWKQITEACNAFNSGWFLKGIKRKVGNGRLTLFWEDPWLDDKPLRLALPRLFQIAENKSSSITHMGEFVGYVWEWRFKWQRSLFVWEENLSQIFFQCVQNFTPKLREEDSWFWCPGGAHGLGSILLQYTTMKYRSCE
jgi:hypothetical protein